MRNSHVLKHLKSSEACKNSNSEQRFTILDTVQNSNYLKSKEALHVMGTAYAKPSSNACQIGFDRVIDVLCLLLLAPILSTY